MKKLRLLPLLLLLLLCLCTTALAASIPGQQSISGITDANGAVTTLTDDEAATAWTKSDSASVDLTISLYRGTVGEIWIRNGYAYTQNWYNNYDRPGQVKVTVYYAVNQYTTSYDTYRYTLSDSYRPNTLSANWNSGYQRLLLPRQYTGVTKIELTIEGVINGYGRTGATISDIIVASGSHATATPKSYATATPKPYVVYVTPTPGPVVEETPPVEFITPPVLLPTPTPTPKPASYPSRGGVIGYANQRIPTRSGPGTGYDEPGSFFSAGHEVKVTSKVWDSNNHLWWYQLEFQYSGEWYRLYTTDHRIDVDASSVPEEPRVGDPLDSRKSLGEHEVYYGPGEEYARAKNALIYEGSRCDIYAIENEWALVDYYDYARDVKRRGWIPLNLLYEN